MSSAIAEIDTPDGRTVLVELESSPSTGMRQVGRGQQVQRISRDLVEVLRDIKPTVQSIVSAVNSAAADMSKITVKLGFKISVSGTVILAAGSAEGHVEVTLEWAGKSRQ